MFTNILKNEKKKSLNFEATIYGVLFSPLEKGLSLAANSGVVFVTASGRLNFVLDYNTHSFSSGPQKSRLVV